MLNLWKKKKTKSGVYVLTKSKKDTNKWFGLPGFRQWTSVVGWKWVWSVCLVFWSPKFLASFPCEICCRKVRGKKENNFNVFGLLYPFSFYRIFPHVFMPTSSGSKIDSNFIMINYCLSHLCEEFHIKFQIPKLIICQNAHKFPNKKHSHTSSKKALTNSKPKKRVLSIQKKNSTTTTKSTLGKTNKSVQSQWEILSSFIRPSHPHRMSWMSW